MLRKFSGSLLFILISLLVISLYADRHQSLEKFEIAIQDAMFQIRGVRPVAQDIAIVGIDDRSLESQGKWPWNRDKIARLVDAVAAQKPKAIVLDMTFGPDENQKAAGYNDSLAAAIARAGNLILGFHYSQNDAPTGDLLPAGLMNSSIRKFDNQAAFSQFPPRAAARIYPPESGVVDSAAFAGFVNVTIDNDRKVRSQALVIGFRGEFFPSIQLAAAAGYLGLNQRDLEIKVGRGIGLGSLIVPTDKSGQLRINYVGTEKTFATFSAAGLLEKRVAPRELTGKLVLIGYCGTGATNIYSTPVNHRLTGLEFDANVIENILHGNSLRVTEGRVDVNLVLMVAIGLLCALLLPRIPLWARIAILVVLLAALAGANYALFYMFGMVNRTFYPALELVFCLVAAPVINAAGLKRNRPDDDDEEEEIDYETLLASGQPVSAQPEPGYPANVDPGVSWPPSASQHKDTTQTATISTPIPVQSRTAFASSAPASTTASIPRSQAGATALRVAEPPPMDHFGRYRILRPIGRGAMGTVYQGLDPAIDRPVALKTLHVGRGADPQEAEELRERLIREAKAAGKLSHPNIVTIYDVGEEGGMQYIAMEYLEGQTLENLLKHGLDWDYRTISRVLIQACEALDYAHENGIVHRDIKPANIMILEGSKVKVMDFGIARVDKSASMTQTGTALGTPNYISPEQLKGMPVDRRSDIFSLGVVFYEILTHEKPFKGDTISALIYSILHTDPARPSELNLDIPRIFDKIVAKALVKDPDMRFQRTKDISEILRKLI
jgi:serine/threonine-protein kinase